MPVDYAAGRCAGTGSVRGEIMRKSLAGLSLSFLIGATGAAEAEKIQHTLTDGMVIELGNYVQTVEIRAKSLGPGGCAVKYTLGNTGNQVQIFSLPGIWSAWARAPQAYFGPTKLKVEEDVICDTGVIAEIRYEK